jgi:hypothetical protein
MRKPRVKSEGYLEDGEIKYKQVLSGKVTPSDYIESRKDTASRNILQCPELYLLRQRFEFYRKFLLFFTAIQRRIILLKYEVIGFRLNELYYNYGIHSDLISRFKGDRLSSKRNEKVKVKIRKVNMTDDFSKEFLSFLAILCRVPVAWFQTDIPRNEWKVDHFHDLKSDETKSKHQFIECLASLNKEQHDVQGLIIICEECTLYLRLENWYGSFLIELFNPLCPAREYLVLRQILSSFKPIEGFMPTVVESQFNYAFMCKHLSGPPVCQPVEFIHR